MAEQYRATDIRFPGKGTLSRNFVGEDGAVIERECSRRRAPGLPWSMYNLDDRSASCPGIADLRGSTAATVYLSPKTP